MNISKILIAICSLLFLIVGADKFFAYLEPPCSLMDYFPSVVWQLLGVLLIISGILIWMPRFRKYVVGFFFVFMSIFTIVHISQNTTDVGGSVFMAILLGLLVWNPGFINKSFTDLKR